MRIKLSTRLVIITRFYAVKIPIDLRGWMQGRNEVKLWSKYGHRERFVPLIWSIGGIVCQPKVPLYTGKIWSHATSIKNRIPELNIGNCDLYCQENWGVYEGEVMLLDYGISHRVSKMY